MMRANSSFDVQGHRGARGLMPENTIAGFLRALDLGVNTLEMDVVISRDDQVVLSHDAWFSSAFSDRPDGIPVSASEQYRYVLHRMSYEEICGWNVGRRNERFPKQEAGVCHKPLLSDVIRAAEAHAQKTGRPPVLYNIETKCTPAGDNVLHPPPEAFVQLLVAVLEQADVLARTTIQSFDPRTLRIVRAIDEPVRTSLLISRVDHLTVEADLRLLGFTPDLYSPDYRLTAAGMIREVHDRGMKLIPWTVNDAVEMRRIIDLGADGFITDYPDTAADVLERRLAP